MHNVKMLAVVESTTIIKIKPYHIVFIYKSSSYFYNSIKSVLQLYKSDNF